MTDDIDTLIANTLKDEDRALLARAGAEPGYFRQIGEVFTGPTSFTARMVEIIGRLYGAKPLIASLNGGSAAVRRYAAKTLGTVGGSGAIEALVAGMTDKDPRLRKEAAWSAPGAPSTP